MPLDYAGNTLSAAKSLNITSNTQTLTDWVGSTDINDYYRFSLNSRSSLNLSLNGLSADANVRLLDANGTTIGSSSKGGTTAESIASQLDAGTYYIQVFPYNSANTYYNLNVSAAPVAPVDYAGNTLSTARNISVGSTSTYSDWVGTLDTNDYYRFSLSDRSSLNLTLNNLTADANVRLIRDSNSNGVVDPNEIITGSYWSGTQAESINTTLDRGTYFAQVYSATGNTYYNLSVSAKPVNVAPNSLQFNLNTSNLKTSDTISIKGGRVYDANGAYDISKVDFRIKKGDGTFIDVSDATSFTPGSDTRSASFSYNLNLNNLNLAAGNNTLWAVAYDKAGATSNVFEQTFTVQAIPAINDWFTQNLKDQQITALTRSLAADNNLSRNDMLAIFRNAEDNYAIDANEVNDLKTLVSNSSRFTMQDNIRWLSGKIAENAYVNISATEFESNLVGRWFLGTVAPTARFDRSNNGTVTTYNLDYMKVEGNLFGSSGQARIGDIDQGYLGDCAFLGALGATFGRQSSDAGNAFSSIINNMIVDNGDKTYTMKFFKNGVAEYTTIDNRLAVYNGSLFTSRNNNNLVNAQNPSTPLWVPFVQKAYAQWREVLEGKPGYNLVGNGDTLANPLEYITGRKANYNLTNNITFSSLETALKNGQALTTGRYEQDTNLIVGGHAYSLTNVYTSGGQQRVVLRNPWGVDNYWWKEKSGSDDGFVDLSFDEFRNTMSEVSIA